MATMTKKEKAEFISKLKAAGLDIESLLAAVPAETSAEKVSLKAGETKVIKTDKHGARLARHMNKAGTNETLVILPGLKGFSMNGEVCLMVLPDGKQVQQDKNAIIRGLESALEIAKSL